MADVIDVDGEPPPAEDAAAAVGYDSLLADQSRIPRRLARPDSRNETPHKRERLPLQRSPHRQRPPAVQHGQISRTPPGLFHLPPQPVAHPSQLNPHTTTHHPPLPSRQRTTQRSQSPRSPVYSIWQMERQHLVAEQQPEQAEEQQPEQAEEQAEEHRQSSQPSVLYHRPMIGTAAHSPARHRHAAAGSPHTPRRLNVMVPRSAPAGGVSPRPFTGSRAQNHAPGHFPTTAGMYSPPPRRARDHGGGGQRCSGAGERAVLGGEVEFVREQPAEARSTAPASPRLVASHSPAAVVVEPEPAPALAIDKAARLRNIDAVAKVVEKPAPSSPQREIDVQDVLLGAKNGQHRAQNRRCSLPGGDVGGKRPVTRRDGAVWNNDGGPREKRQRVGVDAQPSSSSPNFDLPLAGRSKDMTDGDRKGRARESRGRAPSGRKVHEPVSLRWSSVVKQPAAATEVVVLDDAGRETSEDAAGSAESSDVVAPLDEKETGANEKFWRGVGKEYLSIEFVYENVAKSIEHFKALIDNEHVVNLGFKGLTHAGVIELVPLLEECGGEFHHLGMEYNRLTGLPHAFGNLANIAPLTYINLEVNELTVVPPPLLQFNKLQDVNLSKNKLTCVPPELFQLPDLESLALSFNCISTLPLGLGALKKLHFLGLEGNCLKALPDDLGTNNTALRIVDVQFNSDFCCGVPAAMLSVAAQLDHFFFEETELHRLLPRKLRDGSCQLMLEAVAGKSREFVETEVCTAVGKLPRNRRKSEAEVEKEDVQVDDKIVHGRDDVNGSGDAKSGHHDGALASGDLSLEQAAEEVVTDDAKGSYKDLDSEVQVVETLARPAMR